MVTIGIILFCKQDAAPCDALPNVTVSHFVFLVGIIFHVAEIDFLFFGLFDFAGCLIRFFFQSFNVFFSDFCY